jgi:hypothetical protein
MNKIKVYIALLFFWLYLNLGQTAIQNVWIRVWKKKKTESGKMVLNLGEIGRDTQHRQEYSVSTLKVFIV